MELFGIEKLSLVDFDGHVACTVFTGACNFRCGFCHNGPLVTATNKLETVSTKEVIDYIKKRNGILDGICITGGEPTLHKDLPDFIEELKKTGIAVKLDTNGTNPDMIKYLIENKLIDYLAMDIKNSKEHYAKTIGFDAYDLCSVEKSVDYLLSSDFDFEFRTTLINEFHNEKNILDLANWIKGVKKYFMQKYVYRDTCLTNDMHEVSKEEADKMLSLILPIIPTAKLRGYDIG